MSYGALVVYIRNTGNPFDIGSVALGGETEADARAGIDYHVKYYQEMGYTITKVALSRCCETCKGSGRKDKQKRGTAPWMPLPECKACKGTGVAETLEVT